MKISPIFQKDEEYFCVECDKFLYNLHFNKIGRCPDCEHIIQIKLRVDNFDHACHRVNPSELNIGELLSLELDFIHEILAIEKHPDYYRIALKEFRAINIDKDSIITRIDGGWYR